MDDPARVRKLRWLCRRGMKELDILLEQFVGQNADAITRGEWPELEEMLSSEDDLLWDWIQDPGTALNPAYRDILKQIRNKDA